MPGAPLTIGKVADATGVTVSAIRYYDEFGLVEPLCRVGGKRQFHPDTIGRISFIRRAQEAGFTLNDIKQILNDQAGTWPDLVDRHLGDLLQRRAELDTMIAMLEEFQRCGCDVVAQCPRMNAC